MKTKWVMILLLVGVVFSACSSEPKENVLTATFETTNTTEPTFTPTPVPMETPTPIPTLTEEWCNQTALDEYWVIMKSGNDLVKDALEKLFDLFSENASSPGDENHYNLVYTKLWEAKELLIESTPPPCAQEFHSTYLEAVEHYMEGTIMFSNLLIGHPDIEIDDIFDEIKQGTELYDKAGEMLIENFYAP